MIALMMKLISSSETSVYIYQTTWCNIPDDRSHDEVNKFLWNVGQYLPNYKRNIPQDSHLRIHRRENLKSHTGKVRK
jgi:hypothetical protein